MITSQLIKNISKFIYYVTKYKEKYIHLVLLAYE